MRAKKHKHIKKLLKFLSNQNYRTPHRIIFTSKFLQTINTQKLTYIHFNNLLPNCKMYISACTYLHYKIQHKILNKDRVKKMENNEKKKWKKQRFINDMLRYCTVKKCDHMSEKHMECTVEMAKSRKYILGGSAEMVDDFCDLPVLMCKNAELKLIIDMAGSENPVKEY